MVRHKTTFDEDGALMVKGRICAPPIDGLIQKKLEKFYVKERVRLHGVPYSIISDRGTLFNSMFWRKLHDELDTQLTFSTTFQSTNGRTIREDYTSVGKDVEI